MLTGLYILNFWESSPVFGTFVLTVGWIAFCQGVANLYPFGGLNYTQTDITRTRSAVEEMNRRDKERGLK